MVKQESFHLIRDGKREQATDLATKNKLLIYLHRTDVVISVFVCLLNINNEFLLCRLLVEIKVTFKLRQTKKNNFTIYSISMADIKQKLLAQKLASQALNFSASASVYNKNCELVIKRA